MQNDRDGPADVLERDVERMFIGLSAGNVVRHQVAVAVGKGDLERGLLKQPRAPAGVLLWRVVVGRVERSPLALRVRRRNGVAGADSPAPVNLLQLPALVHAKSVGCVAAVETKYGSG